MHVTRLFCPPLNRVGEGSRGNEGQPRISTPKLPLLPMWEKGVGR
jgi:hypothetical protein